MRCNPIRSRLCDSGIGCRAGETALPRQISPIVSVEEYRMADPPVKRIPDHGAADARPAR